MTKDVLTSERQMESLSLHLKDHCNYSDLAIWSGWCLINAILALVAIISGKNKGGDNTSTSMDGFPT